MIMNCFLLDLMDTRVFQIALLELFWNMTLNDCAFQLSVELDGHSIPLVLCMLKSANLFGSVGLYAFF